MNEIIIIFFSLVMCFFYIILDFVFLIPFVYISEIGIFSALLLSVIIYFGIRQIKGILYYSGTGEYPKNMFRLFTFL